MYAIPRKQLGPQPSTSRITISDSDDDFEPPRSKKKKVKFQDTCTLTTMQNDIESIKDSITEITSLSVNTKVPLGLLRILQSTFKCHICHTVPIKPPIILMKFCKQIVGCENCLNQWFSGPSALTKACPLCRLERGYSETVMVRGLDDFLVQIANVLEGNGEAETPTRTDGEANED